jgi:hypothetical protein
VLGYRYFNDVPISDTASNYAIEYETNYTILTIKRPQPGVLKVRATNLVGAATSYGCIVIIRKCILGEGIMICVLACSCTES